MSFLEDEIERLRQMCISCGKCSRACPSLEHGGIDPLEVMMGSDDNLELCINCGCCSQVCHRTDPAIVMKDLQALKMGIHVSQAFEETGFAIPHTGAPGTDLVPDWSDDGVHIMPGCIVECKVPFLKYATASALRSMGIGARELPGHTCCMHPVQFREMHDIERRRYKTALGTSANGETITALCAGCSDELSDSGVSAEHIISLLHRNIGKLPRFDRKVKVALEPGCSAMPLKKEMLEVVEAMGCDSVGTGMGCCGKNISLAGSLMDDREAECADADVIVVGCPMCFVKYDARADGKPVVHIIELVALAAGDRTTLGYHGIPVGL